MWRSLVAAMAVAFVAFRATGKPMPVEPEGSRVPELDAAQAETGPTRRDAAARGVEVSVVTTAKSS